MTVHMILMGPSETPAARAQRLMTEAQEAARDHVVLLEEALRAVAELSAQVANGGLAYPVGIRDLARKMAEDAPWCAGTIAVLRNNNYRTLTTQPDDIAALTSTYDTVCGNAMFS